MFRWQGFGFPITRDHGDYARLGDPRSVSSVLISGKPLPFDVGDHLAQFQHLHRTPFPVMLPANNQIAIVDPVPMRQEIPALVFELSLYQLAAAALR